MMGAGTDRIGDASIYRHDVRFFADVGSKSIAITYKENRLDSASIQTFIP